MEALSENGFVVEAPTLGCPSSCRTHHCFLFSLCSCALEWNDGSFIRPTYSGKGWACATTGVPPSPIAAPNYNLVHRTWKKTVDEPHVGQRGPVKCVAISCVDWPCLSCYTNMTGAAYHLVLLLGESRLYWSKKICAELPSPSQFFIFRRLGL